MCIIKLVYCEHCQRFYNVPKYKPSHRIDYLSIVDDIRCKNPKCFYNTFVGQIELPIPGFEGPCGQPGCRSSFCRIKRIYRLCSQFEERPYVHFAIRKRNCVIQCKNVFE